MYASSPSTNNITVALSYAITDPLNGTVTSTGTVILIDGEGDLASPNWGDADLIMAVANKIGCPAGDVQLATAS